MNFMVYVAQEVREVLASLGLHSLDEAVGRVDLLKQVRTGRAREEALDLSRLLIAPPAGQPRRYMGEPNRVSVASPIKVRLRPVTPNAPNDCPALPCSVMSKVSAAAP